MSNFVQKKMIYAFGIDIQKIQNFVQTKHFEQKHKFIFYICVKNSFIHDSRVIFEKSYKM